MELKDARPGQIVRISAEDYGINQYDRHFSDPEKCYFLIMSLDRVTDMDGNDVRPDRIGVFKIDIIGEVVKGQEYQELRGMRCVKCEIAGDLRELLLARAQRETA